VTDCLILDPKGGGPASYTFGGFFATEGLNRSLSSDCPRPAPSLQLSPTWLTCTSPSISTKMRPTHNSFDSFHIALSCIRWTTWSSGPWDLGEMASYLQPCFSFSRPEYIQATLSHLSSSTISLAFKTRHPPHPHHPAHAQNCNSDPHQQIQRWPPLFTLGYVHLPHTMLHLNPPRL
jgi:hypothetical protein